MIKIKSYMFIIHISISQKWDAFGGIDEEAYPAEEDTVYAAYETETAQKWHECVVGPVVDSAVPYWAKCASKFPFWFAGSNQAKLDDKM